MLVFREDGTPIVVEVKGMSSHNFWIIRQPKAVEQNNLFYVLVHLPKLAQEHNDRPEFFILTADEITDEIRKNEKATIARGSKYDARFGGFNWSAGAKDIYKDDWDKLLKDRL